MLENVSENSDCQLLQLNGKESCESKSLNLSNDVTQSGSLSPLSFVNPYSPSQNINISFDNLIFENTLTMDSTSSKCFQLKQKSSKLVRAVNHLEKKIELLEEVYQVDSYSKPKTKNKLVQCSIDVETPHKMLNLLLSKLKPSLMNYERTIHPAYSEDVNFEDDEQNVIEETNLNNQPSDKMTIGNEETVVNLNHYPQYAKDEGEMLTTVENQMESIPLENEGLDPDIFIFQEGVYYVRVDDQHFHRISHIDVDGSVVTETNFRIELPGGTRLPCLPNSIIEPEIISHPLVSTSLPIESTTETAVLLDSPGIMLSNYSSPIQYYSNGTTLTNTSNTVNSNCNNFNNTAYYHNPGTVMIPNNNSYKNIFNNYSSLTSNPKVVPDYINLPPRPIPCRPFALHSQLLTPELSISMTDNDRELMLTFDNERRQDPQQTPVLYQIYSYSNSSNKNSSKVGSNYHRPHNNNNNNRINSKIQPYVSCNGNCNDSSSVQSMTNETNSTGSIGIGGGGGGGGVGIGVDNISEGNGSNQWSILGEVQAYRLPMFCTINIPESSDVSRFYFAIRSVDEYQRYSDWSNVVQVELAD